MISWLNLRNYESLYIIIYSNFTSHTCEKFRSQFIRAYPLLSGILIPENYDVLCASLH